MVRLKSYSCNQKVWKNSTVSVVATDKNRCYSIFRSVIGIECYFLITFKNWVRIGLWRVRDWKSWNPPGANNEMAILIFPLVLQHIKKLSKKVLQNISIVLNFSSQANNSPLLNTSFHFGVKNMSLPGIEPWMAVLKCLSRPLVYLPVFEIMPFNAKSHPKTPASILRKVSKPVNPARPRERERERVESDLFRTWTWLILKGWTKICAKTISP